MGRGRGSTWAAGASAGAAGGRGGRTQWTEDRVRSELAGFLGERNDWPTVKEFYAAGRSDLYAALMRHGGTKRWAREFRLPHRPQQGGSRREAEPYKWTHARLRTELEEFMGERADWPSPTEFRDAGREDLYAAVLRHGGVDRWAAALGLRLLSGRSRSPYSTHRALRDAREVIAAEGRLPNQKRLSELGFSRLGTAVAQAGGAGAFCRQHGLPVPRGG